MAKIFSFNEGLNGSYICNGIAGTPIAIPFFRTEKGLAVKGNGVNSRIALNQTILLDTVFSLECYIKTGEDNGDYQRLAGYNNSSYPLSIHHGTGGLYLHDGTSFVAEVRPKLFDHSWHHVLVTRNGTSVYFYVDNVVGIEQVLGSNIAMSINQLFQRNGTGSFNGYCAEIIFYNHILTSDERKDAFERFLKASPRGIELYPKPVLPERKPTDLSRYVDTGLCLSYNMIPSAGARLVDISNQNATGAIYGASEILEGLSFDGKDDYVAPNLSIALAATVKTICFRIKLASTTEMILDGDNTGSLIIDTNAGTLQYPAYDNAFIDGVDTDTIFADQWTDVVITSSTAVDNNTPTLGRTTAAAFTYGKFEIADLQYWSNQWTLADAKKYHNSFVKPVLGRIPSVYDPVGSTLPFGCIKGTGSYVVDELTAQDAVLKELDVGTKFLRCTTEGTIVIPFNYAYGTPEFYVKKGDTLNDFRLGIIANGTGAYQSDLGYWVVLNNVERIYFLRTDPGANILYRTISDYFTNITWYGIIPQRTLNGEFTSLIKGGAFGQNYQLIDPTGGGGTNPVTDNTYKTSKYIVADLDVDDCLIIKGWDNGVKQ